MRIVVEDTWFPGRTRIRIGGGSDELTFVRCTFEGGEIHIEEEVDRPIFHLCLFQGTRFSGQPVSSRIAEACSWISPPTEAASHAAGAAALGDEMSGERGAEHFHPRI
jgi:hypothetical protein